MFPQRRGHIHTGTGTLSDLLDLSELFGDFRDEGRAQLARLDAALLTLEAGDPFPDDRRADLLRALHTLKGNAAMLGLRPLQELVHAVEDAFKQAATPATLPLEPLQRAASALRHALEAAGSDEQEPVFATLPPLRAQLADALAASTAPASTPTGAAGSTESAGLIGSTASAGSTASSASSSGSTTEVDRDARAAGSAASTELVESASSTDSGEASGYARSTASAESGEGTDDVHPPVASVDAARAEAAEAASDAEDAISRVASVAGDATEAASSAARSVEIADAQASAAGPRSEGAAASPSAASPSSATPSAASPSSAQPSLPSGKTVAPEESLRIPFARLDPLLSQVDDLSRAVEGLRVWAAERAPELQSIGLRRTLGERLEELDAVAGAVRRSATALRLVPVERVFSRFPPLAAELARERGKRVRVELEGEGTQLDKATADALLDPLLHLVRNAVDHGVEDADARRAAGKPQTATLRLSAAQEGDRVRIEVEDDGRGLDRAAIERRARDLGLLAPEDVPTEEEVDELLFRPGFTTRTRADALSGRGVGLDIVRDTVRRLRGHVLVEDGEDGGTRFVLLVPLTVALVPVLFFQAAGETFAIPALDVEETVRAAVPGRVGPAETVDVHDEAVPLIRLDRVFGWEPAPDPRFVVVLRRGTRAAALGVDRLLAQDAAPVRALPATLGGPRGVSGAVVDARGRVVLLLDPGQMLEMNVDLYRGGPGGG